MRQWTVDERRKQSLAIRNWKPWRKSTGARTVVGKSVSKMNAYKHGGRDADAREVLWLIAQYKKLVNQIA